MQLATSVNTQPWVCTVYFVEDEKLNLYWLSLPGRRHSKELEKNPKAAVAIQIKTGQPVIGIQAEGEVEIVRDVKLVEDIMTRYVQKYGSGKDFISNFARGKNQHVMYKFKPTCYVIFDEMNDTDNPRVQIKVGS